MSDTFAIAYDKLLKKAMAILDRKTKRKDFEVKTVSYNLKISYKNNKLDEIREIDYNLYYVFGGKIRSLNDFFNIIDEILLLD